MKHTVSVKAGVVIRDVDPEFFECWPKIARVFALFGHDATITEVTDTISREYPSYHKTRPVKAADWRTWTTPISGVQLDASIKERICEAIEAECPGVQAIAKRTHIHTELDPAGRARRV